MQILPDDTVEISDQILSQEVNGETVLLDLGSESYFGLDRTGTRIWQLLQSGLNLKQISEVMLGEYEIDETTLKTDIERLLGTLLNAGLVKIAGK